MNSYSVASSMVACELDSTKKLSIALIVVICVLIVVAIVFIVLAATGVFTYSSSPYNTTLNESIQIPQEALNEIAKSKSITENYFWISRNPLFNLSSKFSYFEVEMDIKLENLSKNFILFTNSYKENGQIMAMIENNFVTVGLHGTPNPLIFNFNELALTNGKNYLIKIELEDMLILRLTINGAVYERKIPQEWKFVYDHFGFSIGGKRGANDNPVLTMPLENIINSVNLKFNQTEYHFTFQKQLNQYISKNEKSTTVLNLVS